MPRGPGERQHQHRRGVPWHVGVVPHDHGQPLTGRIHARRPEEVVTIEERGLVRLGPAGRQRDHAARGPARSLRMDLPDRQDPVTVRGGAEPPVVVDLAVGRRGGQRSRRGEPGGARGHGAVAEPHPLVGLVDVGEGTRRPPRHEAHGAAAVLVDAAADAHLARRVVGQTVRSGPDHDDATGLHRARLEPVEGITVGADLRERDLGPGDVARRERRDPTPVTFSGGHCPNVPGAPARGGERRHGPLQ